jgi:prolyl oligopeptidase
MSKNLRHPFSASRLARSLVLTTVASLLPFAIAEGAESPPPPSGPPTAPVREVTDDYFGTKVTDPYRYMEDLNNAEVSAWMKAQNAYTRTELARIPGRADLLARIQQLDESAPARVTYVRRSPSGRYFYLKALSREPMFKLYMRDGLNGKEQLLVDPEKMSAAGGQPYAINYFSPSDDGRYVAYGVSPGGSEDAVLHILDTRSLRDLTEAIDRVLLGGSVRWLPGGGSLLYNRLQKVASEAPATEKYLKSRVYLHVLGTDPEKDSAVFGYDVSPSMKVEASDFSFLITDPASNYALGLIKHGVQNEITAYVAPRNSIRKPNARWRKVCDVEDQVTNFALRGDDLYLLTHRDASRFKVIRTHAASPDLTHAEVVVPSSEAVITDLGAASDALYVELRDGAIGRLARVSYRAGAKPEPIALPLDGAVGLFPPDTRLPGALFVLTTWTRAPRIYGYEPKTKATTDTGLRPVGQFDAPKDVEFVEVKARSHDGTMVPLSIIHRRGLKLDGSHPTLLDGYGAYGISRDPSFDPKLLAWLERGGVYAVAHVRGGGEYGEDWHLAGKKLTKPNTWRDFLACAEYLIDKKYTSPAHLSGTGGSAGGILIGRAITERPELFAAALILVGATDSLRTEQMAGGPANIPEFGTVKEPDGFKGLYEMSAYAHVKNGTAYPAVMLITGINDPRVAPWQAAKMAARLQASSTSGKPVLLRIDYEAGHGIGSTKKQQQEQRADEYSFLLWQLGVPEYQPNVARKVD